MPDLQIIMHPATGNQMPHFDLAVADGDLAVDAGLETAVTISLFTDRRAEPDDILPDGGSDRRGWWGDAWPAVEGDRIGSRLWLLSREKQAPDVLRRAREYAAEALQWLVADGIASDVQVEAGNPRPGLLALDIRITRPDRSEVDIRYDNVWEVIRGL